MYDPIEEDGFALLNRDAATKSLIPISTKRFFGWKIRKIEIVYPQDLAMKNLEALGYQNLW